MKAFATFVALCLAVITAAAQAPATAPPPAPPDVASVPADAAKTSSGLASRMITEGDGSTKVAPTDVVTVHYTAWTPDGKMFDSSRTRGNPSMFPLNRSLVGWRECVQLMTIGETRRCWVPENLAYKGQAGRPKGTVLFEIELLDTRGNPLVPPPDVKAPPADAKRTPDGLAYKVLRPGKGVRNPSRFGRVTVHYTGWTVDGRMFDSSVAKGQPATFRLDDVIKGWTEGVPLMVEGERTRFWVPENLAYGGKGDGPRGMLVFDIELIRIEN